MESIIVCGYCDGILKNPYSPVNKCMSCTKKKYYKKKYITNIKEFIGERNYYWLDSVKTILGNDFDEFIEAYGKEGVIFTKNKFRGRARARLWRIKKRALKSIYCNDSIGGGTLDAIAMGTPISFEEAFVLLSKYRGGEDRMYQESKKGDGESGIEFVEKNIFDGIKSMLFKYDAMARGDLDCDIHEQFIMFAMENMIDIDIVRKLLSLKRIQVGIYDNVVEIYEKWKKLPNG